MKFKLEVLAVWAQLQNPMLFLVIQGGTSTFWLDTLTQADGGIVLFLIF